MGFLLEQVLSKAEVVIHYVNACVAILSWTYSGSCHPHISLIKSTNENGTCFPRPSLVSWYIPLDLLTGTFSTDH